MKDLNTFKVYASHWTWYKFSETFTVQFPSIAAMKKRVPSMFDGIMNDSVIFVEGPNFKSWYEVDSKTWND